MRCFAPTLCVHVWKGIACSPPPRLHTPITTRFPGRLQLRNLVLFLFIVLQSGTQRTRNNRLTSLGLALLRVCVCLWFSLPPPPPGFTLGPQI